MNRIGLAIESVDRDAFVLQENGTQLLQSTSTNAIVKSLRLLDLQEGQRILEIGTGSGYSTALLANLVGSTGHVVSIDIDPFVVDRARQCLIRNQVFNVTVVAKDGREGYEAIGQYDRIVAWTTADELPYTWVQQLNENGIIVAPFMLLPLAQASAIARLRKDSEDIKGDLLLSGGYIPMNKSPKYESYGPELRADIVEKNGLEVSVWGSSIWMKRADTETKKKWIQLLNKQPLSQSLLKGGESYNDFHAFLLGKQPESLTTAFLEKAGFFIGDSTASSFALLSEEFFLTQGSNQSIHSLQSWLEEWRSLGCPGFEKLKPVVKKDNTNWVIRAKLDG